jgi:hypothetical protein BACCOPRO_01210
MKKLSLPCILCILLTACTEERDFDIIPTPKEEIEFICTKSPDFLPSRASIDSINGEGNFIEGDKIGLYVELDNSYNYHTLTLQNQHWRGVDKQDLGTYLTTINAIYPAKEIPIESGHLPITINTNQATKEKFEQSDILGAHQVIPMYSNPHKIELQFKHLMHKVNIVLQGVDDQKSSVKVEVHSKIKGKLNLNLGTTQAIDDSSEEWIRAYKVKNNEYSTILFPQPISGGTEWIKITIDEKSYIYKSPYEIGGSKNLDPGKQSEITLTLTNKPEEPVDLQFANSKHWIYGITLPTFDESTAKEYVSYSPENFPVGEWFTIKDTSDNGYLTWTEGSNWYDCDKTNPYQDGGYPGYIDHKMCWAAAASNMLHWWTFHNRDYIQKYDDIYGEMHEKFTRPSAEYLERKYEFSGSSITSEGSNYKKLIQSESEIFDFFRNYCQNIGNSSNLGVNWFITGAPGPPVTQTVLDFKGFFNKAFTINDDIATLSSSYPQKEEFNRIIKDAFNTDKALGFSIATSYGLHDMTIWGAEFDDKGDVSAIYYVDNNDYFDFDVVGGTPLYQRHILMRKKVTYDTEGMAYFGTSFKTVFQQLATVSLRRDIWEKWEKETINR